MTEAEVNLIPLADLPTRYGISRSVIYDRLGALNIEPTRSGKRAFIKAQDLKLLDELDEHLKRGGITSEFVENMSGIHTATDTRQIENDLKVSTQVEETRANLTLISELVNQLNANLITSDPLSDYEALERACRNGWLLSTSRLASLLGLSPKTLVSHKKLSRYGFLFTKEGRNGIETAWRVSKSQ